MYERCENGKVETSVYRKPTNNNIYIHWDAYGPKQWKTGTLAGIIRRAYDICSTDDRRSNELTFIYKVFTEINSYPKGLVTSMLKKAKDKFENNRIPTNEEKDDEDEIPPITLKVPYRGKEGERLLKRMQEKMVKDIPTEVPVRTVHTGTKISKYFRLKDKTEDRHLSNFVYKRDCRNRKCKDDYIGETARRKEIRSDDHAGKDKMSHIYQDR